ncbi:MAG TPA: acyltransferase family protein [Frankiaceae bacterium]|nr:acyltransferase family protein [Frankiaceae bacterium]
MERTGGLPYVPALDGVRGVAVLAVLLFHGGVSWLPGGFLGVDAFFVLSGYLITGLLLAGVPLRTFWSRRVRRLLPALALLVLVVLCLGSVLNAAPRDALGALTYLSNWRSYATGGGYFASFADPSAFKHTWSLAVEAQFYVVWPLLVVCVCRRARGPVLAAAGVGALVSAAAMAASFRPGGDPARAYYGTDTRIQALLVGAALAVVLARAAVPRAIGWSGLAGVGLTLWVWHTASGTSDDLYGGGFLLAAVATAAVIASVVLLPSGPLARALSVRPLRAVGIVSYGVYLWHWPVFLLLTGARTGLSGFWLLALRFAATAACTAVSWYAVEVPARTWSPRLPPLHVRRVALAGGTAFALAAFLALSPGTPPGPPSAAADPLPTASPTAARRPARAPTTTAPTTPAPTRAAGGPTRVLVLGDSVAQTLAAGLPDGDGFDVVNAAALGCGLVTGGYRYFGGQYDDPPHCVQWPQTWGAAVARHQPDLVAVLVGRWEVMDRRLDGEWRRLGDAAFDAYVTAQLDRAVDVVSAGGTKVALVTAPYYLRGERPDGGRFPEDDPARVDRFNALLRDVAARRGVAVVELGAALAPEGTFTRHINGTLVRYDGVHISGAGARMLRPWLLRQLTAAL